MDAASSDAGSPGAGEKRKSSLASTHSPFWSRVSVGPQGLSRAAKQADLVPIPPQDLLKHTPEDHPDHPLLLDAQRNIKQVAERINKGVRSAEEAERHARVLQEIEAHIEGMEDVRAAPLHPTPPIPVSICGHRELWPYPSTVVSPVCLYCVYQHLHPSLSTSMSFPTSVSGCVSHDLTVS